MPQRASWLRSFILAMTWVLEAAVRAGSHAFAFGRWVLGRIFQREEDPVWVLPLNRPSRSIRFLKHLGRQRRREGMIACDLGSLAKAVDRQGLREHARGFARAAFGHWQRARSLDRRIRRRADQAFEDHAR